MNLDPTNREHLEAIIKYLRINGGGFTVAYYVTMAALAAREAPDPIHEIFKALRTA